MNINIAPQTIISLASNDEVYARGNDDFIRGKLKNISIFYKGGIAGVTAIKATVTGNATDYFVEVSISSSEILGYKCSCPSMSIWRGACRHVVCTLVHVVENGLRLKKMNADKVISRELTQYFKKKSIKEIEKKNKLGKISVAPVILMEYNSQARVEFTVGEVRQYVIKNIVDFIGAVAKEEQISYGKNFSFIHSIDSFDEVSQNLISVLTEEFNTMKMVKKAFNLQGYTDYTIRTLPLTPHLTEKILNLYKDDFVTICDYKDLVKKQYFLTEEKPDMKFEVEITETSAKLKTMELKEMEILSGNSNEYVLINEMIHIVPRKYLETLNTVFGMTRRAQIDEIEFSGDELNNFMYYMLPMLEKDGLLNLKGEIPEQIRNSDFSECKLYFDMNSRNDITLKATFCYGGNEINPLDSENAKIIRNELAEHKILYLIESYGFSGDKSQFVLNDDDLIYELYMMGLADFQEVATVYVSSEFDQKVSRERNSTAKFGLRIQGNLLETSIESNYTLKELLDSLKSFDAKKKYHRLKDGKLMVFKDEAVSKGLEILSSLEVSKNEIRNNKLVLPKHRTLYLDNIFKDSKDLEIIKDGSVTKLIEDFNSIDDTKFEIPSDLDGVLRGYQKIGFRWLKMLSHYGFGGILADDMGLGKTLQVISLLLSEMESNCTEKSSIVVTPTSLIYNWNKELKKFAPQINATVIDGVKSERVKTLESMKNSTNHVFITTYDMLKRDIENYQEIEFRYIIADEAQYIKNPSTQNSTALKRLIGDSRFALTGTPIENSLMELWSIFDFIMNGYLFSSSKFTKNFESAIVRDGNKEKANHLRKLISPFIMRRLKTDVLKELPEKLETTLYAEMEREQKKLYISNLMKAKGELDELISENNQVNQIKILSELTRLRQICCHPSLFLDSYNGGSGKLDLAIETINSATTAGHRILLFSQFTTMLAIIKESLEREGISYLYLDGTTSAKSRSELVERFNSGEKDIFLISLKAGGTGLNLTGADVVIHYDPWWNPAVMNQATDRAHRFGQQRNVQVINIVAKDSIEEKILELHSRKKDLVDSVIREGENFISKMSLDEVRELFSV